MQRIYDLRVCTQGFIAEEAGSPAFLNSLYRKKHWREAIFQKFEMYRFLDREDFFPSLIRKCQKKTDIKYKHFKTSINLTL